MERLVRQYRLPSIWVNVKRAEDAVHPDDLTAGRLATELLLSHGHRRVAFLDITDPWAPELGRHYSLADRQRGYERAMRAAKAKPSVSGLVAKIRLGRDVGNEDERVAVLSQWLGDRGRLARAIRVFWAFPPAIFASKSRRHFPRQTKRFRQRLRQRVLEGNPGGINGNEK